MTHSKNSEKSSVGNQEENHLLYEEACNAARHQLSIRFSVLAFFTIATGALLEQLRDMQCGVVSMAGMLVAYICLRTDLRCMVTFASVRESARRLEREWRFGVYEEELSDLRKESLAPAMIWFLNPIRRHLFASNRVLYSKFYGVCMVAWAMNAIRGWMLGG